MSDYVLGTSDHELDRLSLQQEVWLDPTTRFLDALEIRAGWDVLDLGCGPGFVVEMLRERVGESGSVVGLDESPRWMEVLGELIARRGWANVRAMQGRLQELDLEPASLDLIFMRWVLAFLPGRDEIVRELARFLKPGGVLAVMDYNHEGLSLFPDNPGFRAVVQGTRDLYAKIGGDTWVMGDIARIYRQAGLEPTVVEPFVIAGRPGSPAFRWADAFFPFHTEGMVAAGALSEEDRELFLREWPKIKADPDTLFFSPIVAGAAGRKPSTP